MLELKITKEEGIGPAKTIARVEKYRNLSLKNKDIATFPSQRVTHQKTSEHSSLPINQQSIKPSTKAKHYSPFPHKLFETLRIIIQNQRILKTSERV
jgi:hypothetical protein